MRSDTYEVGFANGGDFHHLCNAADIRQGGADEIDIVIFHEFVELPAVARLLARRQWDVYLSAQDRKILREGFRPNRVFDEERREFLAPITAPDRVCEVESRVEFD